MLTYDFYDASIVSDLIGDYPNIVINNGGNVMSAQSNRCAVNVSKSSSAEGLKQALQQEASNRGLSLSKLVGKIFIWAVNNNEKFHGSLKQAAKKPGDHISTSVSANVRDQLNIWARKTDRERSHLCCFILEKVLEDNLLDIILKNTPYVKQ